MTRILLHIGPDPLTTRAVQAAAMAQVPADDRRRMYPRTMGAQGQTALFLASLDPDHVDPLRAARGLGPEDRQEHFVRRVETLLDDIAQAAPDTLVLSCDLLGRDLRRTSELNRLRDLLHHVSEDITVVAYVPAQAQAMAAHWSEQILWGRCTPLADDLPKLRDGDWTQRPAQPDLNDFPELECPAHWLTIAPLLTLWRPVFPAMTVLPSVDALHRFLDLTPHPQPALPSAQTLARVHHLNQRIRHELHRGLILPRKQRAGMVASVATEGPPLCPETIEVALSAQTPTNILPEIVEFDPARTLSRLRQRMIQMTRVSDIGQNAPAPQSVPAPASLPPEARDRYARLVHSRYAPHNRIAPAPGPDTPFPTQDRPTPTPAERILIACMKDEGPYVLEWLAYHRLIGFDHFVIYTNDCSDGTDALLDHLVPQGWLTHIDNSDWHGKSPQQAALNQAIALPVVRNATWVLHCDVDEFVNIRVGDGTLSALFDAVPQATHWALTWRLFGSNGVRRIHNRPVIGQFTQCAPAFCPKPHTVWGFKTLGRQIGAYGKLSCHRPTKPVPDGLDRVVWVNGSGQPMDRAIAQKGWRNSIKTIGYDLVQLNHYALRSRDSFLVKRKRGRALHVDRQIGHNYWVRMDWNDHEDHSILRNLPRLDTALRGLKSDPDVRRLHKAALRWHRDRAESLKRDPQMIRLMRDIEALSLTQTERAAYAMALDMES